MTSSTAQDSPSYVWESCYAAIATANQVLEAIAELTEQDASLDLSAQKGGALLCRPTIILFWSIFFAQAYKDEERSLEDLGIPM